MDNANKTNELLHCDNAYRVELCYREALGEAKNYEF